MKIVTVYGSNPVSGAGKVVAKGHGKQKTTAFDPALSTDQNHGIAAANLILANGVNGLAEAVVEGIDAGESTHDQNDAGTIHTFNV